jgi:hypothetical protein
MSTSMFQAVSKSVAQVADAIGSIGGVVSKNMIALDRASDASYSHADTFVQNTELRNAGSIKDTILDEEERDLHRDIQRLKFAKAKENFIKQLNTAGYAPDLVPPGDRDADTKDTKTAKTAKK